MELRPTIALVVAVARNGVIGRDGAMPWHLTTDLRHFKELTSGRPVIMGRRTHESIGRALPGRLNIVVTRNHDWFADNVLRVGSIGAAIDLATAHLEAFEPDPGDEDPNIPDEIFIIGGGEIYAQAFWLADMLYITHVDSQIDGDTHFPPVDENHWELVDEEAFPAGPKDTHPMRFATYVRRQD